MATLQKISANLWFDKQAEDAARFYTGIFKSSKLGRITHYGKEGFEVHHMPAGTVMTVEFELNGQSFVALNGGPIFKFNEAISFLIHCETQEEIDYYWNKLNEGGDPEAQQCGWLKDKFGVSWQVVPKQVFELWGDMETPGAQRAFKAMMQMMKLDLAELQRAYKGG
jgi:predicted 3-demethylubiquinone-9 3-methyltransferase (glyoxalase superfamily)